MLLGVNRQTLGKYLKREDFPKGLYLPGANKMSWRLEDIIRWGKESLTEGPTFEKTKFVPKALL